MKILFLFMVILSISTVSSISTTMLPSYQGSETMIIEIQGNILEPISRSDIVFKRSHVAIAVDYDIKKIGDDYYLYAQVPTNPNNYTLFINNVVTLLNGQSQVVNFNQTFEVTSNLTDYSINPGFIITNKDFSINIESNLDQEITINSNFPEEMEINLNPGINNINFDINQKPSGFYIATIGKYQVPILITNNQVQEDPISILVYPNLFRETTKANVPKVYGVSITNKGTNTLEQVYLAYNKDSFLISNESFTLEVNETVNLSISLVNLTKDISDFIFIAKGSETIANISFQIKFTQNDSQVTNSSNPEYYCSELGGKFCSALEVCAGQSVQTLDGLCCVGNCSIGEESSSNSWIIYILISVVMIILVYIYIKYKKTKVSIPKNLPLSSIKRPI